MTISGGLGGRAKKNFRLAIARHDPPSNTLLIFTLGQTDRQTKIKIALLACWRIIKWRVMFSQYNVVATCSLSLLSLFTGFWFLHSLQISRYSDVSRQVAIAHCRSRYIYEYNKKNGCRFQWISISLYKTLVIMSRWMPLIITDSESQLSAPIYQNRHTVI